MPNELQTSVKRCASGQADTPALATAIRRLVEIGLAVGQPSRRIMAKTAARAVELAEAEIDRRTKDAPAEERTVRKRRVLKGPSIFRKERKD